MTALVRDRGRRRGWTLMSGLAGAVATIALVAAVAVGRPALALDTRMVIGSGLSSCPAGYVCLWTQSNFGGTGYAFYNSESNYATLPAPYNAINDESLSFYSHGNTYDIRFYRTSSTTSDNFVLCKGESIAQLPANSEVPSHTTIGARGWRDAISRHDFGAYC